MGAVPIKAVLVDPSKVNRNQNVVFLALVDEDGNAINLESIGIRLDALEEQVFEPEEP